MNEPDSTFYLTAYFSGHVQGVGFRYSTAQLAKGYEVTGFVRNLADGRVELEIEGEKEECREMLASVVDELDAYVRKTESSEGRRAKSFTTFRIA
ncbi:acylphosphatase [Pelagicoccus sp. NFK12]|uniref:acylphosphatase n=1 Tax=Pelagicoccus enzymogenes TaxID=2773457 RepID=A0A927F8X8_9BACT|nr:acylphosphatase [Pelagicoccus enzymogenes]MBD5779345.1 acylphosphatase [Pelagicoccus enzymogenes]MDQ8198303.1 acylphosphatase [Pelagicoccus enzymogenes]